MARRKNKDLWKPNELDHEEIHKHTELIINRVRAIQRNQRSINVDIDYEQLVKSVSELHDMLQLTNLKADNRRRFLATMEKVRKVHG